LEKYASLTCVNNNEISRFDRPSSNRGAISIWDMHAPFGGYKQSSNGREYADFGLGDFLAIKGIVGFGAATLPSGS
jgi:hypothetical protein